MSESRFDEGAFATDLDAANCGDESGLSSLFRAFHPRLLRYLRAREPSRADDIAGETWVAVSAQIGAFEASGHKSDAVGVDPFTYWAGACAVGDDGRAGS